MAASKDFMIGVIVGSAIGAAAALLYAPMAGTETRLLIKEKAGEAGTQAGELAQQARARATEVAHQAQERIGEVKGQIQTKATEVKDQIQTRAGEIGNQAQGIVDRGRHMIDTQREAVVAAVDAGKQAFQQKQSELQQEVDADTMPAPTATPTI
jgi:gas vesicle protein